MLFYFNIMFDNNDDDVACVASVSNRVIARKLERKQKKVEGGGEKRKRLPANPTILENAPWYFTVRFICKLTARQNRSITNRLPLDYQICKITLVSNRTRCPNLKKNFTVPDLIRCLIWLWLCFIDISLSKESKKKKQNKKCSITKNVK